MNQVPKWGGSGWVCGGAHTAVALAAFPETVDNTVHLVIGHIFGADVVLTSGPGLRVERIPGFRPDGQPSDAPGFNTEFPIVFEYAGDQAAALQQFHDTPTVFGTLGATLIVEQLSGTEAFRWNVFHVRLTAVEAGDEGRTRYTLTPQPNAPDAIVNLATGGPFQANASHNPATDTPITISGIVTGAYPVVEVDAAARTVALTFDFAEAGHIFQWIHNTATGADFNRTLTVYEESSGTFTPGTIFYEVFPISFQHFTGFSQPAKVKMRLVVTYGFSEAM